MMSRYKKNFGDFGESIAEAELIKKGYKILAKNYYTKYGEIDIIALTPGRDVLVFTEVKTRRNKNHGLAAESVNTTKIRHLIRSAQQYALENPTEAEIRFDVVEVYADSLNEYTKVNHIVNAFPDISQYL